MRGLYDEMTRVTVGLTWAKVLDFETSAPAAVEGLVRRKQDHGQ